MNTQEAKRVLRNHLRHYRARTYEELASLVGRQEISQIEAGSGTMYQIEVQAFWDDSSKHTIRVTGAIDDGGIRAFMPLSLDFIISPDGSFVGG